MPDILDYDDLDMNRVDGVLEREGELFLSLAPNHAKACIAFIETIRTAQAWSPRHVARIARIPPLISGWWVTLRILFRHSRIFELGRVVVLNSSGQSWHALPDGSYLFRFSKKPDAA